MSVLALPMAPAGSVQEQVTQQYAYLVQMAQQLNLALGQLEALGGGAGEASARRQANGRLGTAASETADGQYETLRSMILKTADQVQKTTAALTAKLEEEYVASSDFGSYVAKLSAQLEAAPEAVTQYYSFFSDLQANVEKVDAAFAHYKLDTEGYIRTGIVYYDGAAPVYGVAVGQDLTCREVDGEKVVATTRSGALEDLLEQLKLGYETADTVNAYFVEDVDIRQEYVESSYVMNLGYIAEILNETKEGEVTYTVTSGDSYYSIAAKYDMSVDDLMKLNVGYDPKILRVGDVLTISNAVPYLTVVNVERQRYVQDVPYEVEYTDDASMYQGEYKVTSPGVYGKADMTANVTYINGEETEREVVASVTLSQPVTEQQLRGTKERPTWYPTGSFSWPCTGILTSRFGYRSLLGSTYHSGIDIGNSYGTSIYASDGGTVTYSGWMSGYGYLIIIDHGNGYQTYYGHNSSLVASLGQKVHKGQLIARMGSTGRSTGNHCHFGVKFNGTFVNPLNYL